MRIVTVVALEDCLNGSRVLRYEFDTEWTGASVRALGRLGSLDYYADFPRPFFRLRTGSGLDVRGVEGTATCRVVLPRGEPEAARRAFEAHFGSDPGPGVHCGPGKRRPARSVLDPGRR